MSKEQIIVLLIVAVLGVLTFLVFKYGKRAKDLKPGELKSPGCMGCAARTFCNDIQRYEHIADGCPNRTEYEEETGSTSLHRVK